MVGIGEVLLGGVFALIGVWALDRLSVVANAARALRGVPADDTTRFSDGQTVAVEGPVFVDEPAPVVERLFDTDTETVGASSGTRGFRTPVDTRTTPTAASSGNRSTFASGLEAGRVGVTTDGQSRYTDVSWLQQLHDSDTLSRLEVGDPRATRHSRRS